MEQNKTLTVSLDKVYGKEVVRPICHDAKVLCEIAGAKTFTQRQINLAKLLGYQFEVVGVPSQDFTF